MIRIVWSEGYQKPFSTLQQALMSVLILAPPDPLLPFVLGTDASGTVANDLVKGLVSFRTSIV